MPIKCAIRNSATPSERVEDLWGSTDICQGPVILCAYVETWILLLQEHCQDGNLKQAGDFPYGEKERPSGRFKTLILANRRKLRPQRDDNFQLQQNVLQRRETGT